MIIAIDFDGTVHTGVYPHLGLPIIGAQRVIQSLHGRGHYIIVNTCRDGQNLVDAINFMLEHDIPFSRVNDNHPDNVSRYGSNARKIFADVYIDDRQVGGLPSWSKIEDYITTLEQDK